MDSPAPRPAAEYDRFSDIYRVWTQTAASARANLGFYVDAYEAANGPVVELGVGDGTDRRAGRRARRGPHRRGPLGRHARAMPAERQAAGVLARLTLLQADFRHFDLPNRRG